MNSIPKEDETVTVTKDGLDWLVIPGRNQDFWSRLQAGKWEPELFKHLQNFINSETIFLDVGGWIGPATLFGAQLAKKTYTFEPNPEVFSELSQNVSVNSADWVNNISLMDCGVYLRDTRMSFGYLNLGDSSTGSFLNVVDDKKFQVVLIDFKKFIKDQGIYKNNVFMKMDIEGGEFDVVPHLREYLGLNSFNVLLSLHPQFLFRKIKDMHPGYGVVPRLKRRLEMARSYRRVYSAFPNRNIYNIYGVKLGWRMSFLNLILRGSFPSDILVY